jgi:hypothetical protein
VGRQKSRDASLGIDYDRLENDLQILGLPMLGSACQRCLHVTWDGKELYGSFSSPIAESARENGCAARWRIGNSCDDYEVFRPSIRHLRIEIPLRPIGMLPVPDEPESTRAFKRESGKRK